MVEDTFNSNISEYIDSVIDCINECINNVVPKVTVCTCSNPKNPGSAQRSTLNPKCGQSLQLRGPWRIQSSQLWPPEVHQGFQGSLQGIPATCGVDAASLQRKKNRRRSSTSFRLSLMRTTQHREVAMLILEIVNVRKSFKRINTRKSLGPDHISGQDSQGGRWSTGRGVHQYLQPLSYPLRPRCQSLILNWINPLQIKRH